MLDNSRTAWYLLLDFLHLHGPLEAESESPSRPPCLHNQAVMSQTCEDSALIHYSITTAISLVLSVCRGGSFVVSCTYSALCMVLS